MELVGLSAEQGTHPMQKESSGFQQLVTITKDCVLDSRMLSAAWCCAKLMPNLPACVCISDMYSHEEIKHISDSIGHHIVSVFRSALCSKRPQMSPANH